MAGAHVRRGLAIVGGGAKGAYSLGCMKALHRAGFHFEAVSGTSAGSLNAAVWSSGDIEAGERLWAEMSPQSSYRRRSSLQALPRSLARLVGTGVVILALLIAQMRGYPIDGKSEALVRRVLFLSVWGFATLATILISGAALSQALVITLAGTLFIWPIIRGGGPRKGRTSLKVLLFFLCLIAVSQLAAGLIPDVGEAGGLAVLVAILPGAAILFGLLVLILTPFTSLAVLDSAPLKHTLTGFLQNRPLRIPTYVTAAHAVDVFDPDAPVWIPTAGPGHVTARDISGPWDPFPDARWVPEYVRIDQQPSDRAVDWLMATAALPFGVVPSVTRDKIEYVDGGVVDNVPVLPLLSHNLDEIIVLELNPAATRPGPDHPTRCARLQRLHGLARMPLPPRQHVKPSRDYREPPQLVPLPQFPRFPNIVEIRPAKSLGGIFSGLLNFSPEYSQRLIREGQADTERCLLALGLSGSSMS